MAPPHLRCLSGPCFSWSPQSSSFSLLIRKFAMSVKQRTSYAEGKPVLRGVVFDMDGTLTVPVIDFAAMYRAVLGDEGYTAAKFGSPGGSVDILHHIETWPPQEQQRAYEIIADFERQGLDRLQIMPVFRIPQNSIVLPLATGNSANSTTVPRHCAACWRLPSMPTSSTGTPETVPNWITVIPALQCAELLFSVGDNYCLHVIHR